MSTIWHLITPEFPPSPGGVSDYSDLLSKALAGAGDQVVVWAPGNAVPGEDNGVTVRAELGKVSLADIRRTGSALQKFPGKRRLVLQWVPHGFGLRSMNLPFCVWIWLRANLHGDDVQIMVHEPFLAFGEGSWKQDLAAGVHRLMILFLLQSSRRVWTSTLAWIDSLSPWTLGRRIRFEALPIPSNIPVSDHPSRISQIRAAAGTAPLVLGHFGTYGRVITELLARMVPIALRCFPKAVMLLIGPAGDRFREQLIAEHPDLADRLIATGYLDSAEVSHHISACDVMLQPYPDGVTTRRGSTMAALSHGRATITTTGRLSEPFWKECDALAVHEVDDDAQFERLLVTLCESAEARQSMGKRACEYYNSRFDIRHTVAKMRAASSGGDLP